MDLSDLRNDEICLELLRITQADPSNGLSPAYFFSIRRQGSGEDIGRCDLRVGHNMNLYYGGNIGYRVFEPYRGHRYAGKACTLLFDLARKNGLDYIYITCNPDNLPSRKTCERLGGKLEAIVDLPPDNDMYLAGERQKCVFYYKL